MVFESHVAFSDILINKLLSDSEGEVVKSLIWNISDKDDNLDIFHVFGTNSFDATNCRRSWGQFGVLMYCPSVLDELNISSIEF